jgi:sugar phosphate isomerase/epimerase
MLLGIFAKTFARPSVAGVFEAVSASGLDAVQFNMACAGMEPMPATIPVDLARHIRQSAAQHGVRIAAASGTFNMIHPDLEVRREGLSRLQTLVAAARSLGTEIVTLCTGTRDALDHWRHHPDNATAEAWRDLRRTLGAALGTAEQHGIVLAFEPEPGNVVDTALKGRLLLEEMRSPNLKVVLDPANLPDVNCAAASRARIDEALALLGPDIAIAHVKDRDASGAVRPPGSGVIDFAHYFARLERIGFTGALIMHGFAEPAVAGVVSYVRGLLARPAAGA